MLSNSTSCNLFGEGQTPILISQVQCQLKFVKFHHPPPSPHQIKKCIFGLFIKHSKMLELRDSLKWREIESWRNVHFCSFSKGWRSCDNKKCTWSLKFLLSPLLNTAYIFWQIHKIITVMEWASFNPDKTVLKKSVFLCLSYRLHFWISGHLLLSPIWKT